MNRWLGVLTGVAITAAVAGCAMPPRVNRPPAGLTGGPLLKSPIDPLGKLEKSLVFQPAKYPAGNWTPEGLVFEEARFESADGTPLHGWYVPHDRPRAVVLFCHGNAGNVTHRIETLRTLHDRVGVSVMIFDYRGYGQSEGTPSEAGVLADARAARAWLARRTHRDENEIVLLGRSLGGGVAVDLAAADGAGGLVLESTFPSIPEVAASGYPWLPVRSLMRTRFDSLAKIGDYHGPLLQSDGDADTTIPYKLGRRLFDAANEPKQFVTIPGGGHNDPQTPEYYRALIGFLDRLTPARAGFPAR
jgi:fermentation-respiration switch protein FrsA (DUF1100 family)